MSIKQRLNRLERDKAAETYEPVFVWGDAPAPSALKPHQELIRVRWSGDRKTDPAGDSD